MSPTTGDTDRENELAGKAQRKLHKLVRFILILLFVILCGILVYRLVLGG